MKSIPPTPPRGNPPLTPRSTASQRTPNAAKGSPELERALALRDVMDHAVRVQKETTGAKRLGPSRARMITTLALCGALLALSTYSWLARPAFIWGPQVRPSPARQEANVRMAMTMLAQRLDAFREATGAYPRSLAEVGEGASGIGFRLLSDSTYELRDSIGGATPTLVLRSSDRRDQFLGNGIAAIGGHAR